MRKKLAVESLSIASPRSNEELTHLLDQRIRSYGENSLVVLPEYFIDGESQYEGRSIQDPMVRTLSNFAIERSTHIVAGMVEKFDDGDKLINGLFISPDGGIEKQGKRTPTTFEIQAGVVESNQDTQVFNLRRGMGRLSIAMCVEIFELDSEFRKLDSEILINPRGFDLDDERFGNFSEAWLNHNRDQARMGKRFVIGATGSMGKSGAMSEVIDFEGNVIAHGLDLDRPIFSTLDLNLLNDYRSGKYISSKVPKF